MYLFYIVYSSGLAWIFSHFPFSYLHCGDCCLHFPWTLPPSNMRRWTWSRVWLAECGDSVSRPMTASQFVPCGNHVNNTHKEAGAASDKELLASELKHLQIQIKTRIAAFGCNGNNKVDSSCVLFGEKTRYSAGSDVREIKWDVRALKL